MYSSSLINLLCLHFLALEQDTKLMSGAKFISGFVNRPYKLQRCDRDDQRRFLVPGDLIEYVRGPFSHWAVYLGHERIAHLPGPSNLFANFQVRHREQGAVAIKSVSRSVKRCGESPLATASNRCKWRYEISAVYYPIPLPTSTIVKIVFFVPYRSTRSFIELTRPSDTKVMI